MLTSILLEAAKNNKLIIVEGGICRFSRLKGDTIKITDILSIKRGAGQEILKRILDMNPSHLIASCPEDWSSNDWYLSHGFAVVSQSKSRTGKLLNNYRFNIKGLF